MRIARWVAAAIMLLLPMAQGCAGVPGTWITSAPDIARDAAALNDAYSRASSGQILLNVLRSRDRWPREYVTLGGISTQPTASFQAGLTLNPLPLNNPEDPLRSSTGPVSRTQSSAYNYNITPLSTATINQAVLTPVKRVVFEHYWNSRWMRDVILLVMAESMRRYVGFALEPDGAVPANEIQALIDERRPNSNWGEPWLNSPTDDEKSDGDPCRPDMAYNGSEDWPPDVAPAALSLSKRARECIFFQIVHRMADRVQASVDGSTDIRLRELPTPRCRESTSIDVGDHQALRSLAAASEASGGNIVIRLAQAQSDQPYQPASRLVLARCPAEPNQPVLLEVLGPPGRTKPHRVEATYLVSLRSLDDMIYAMGRLLRSERAVEIARAEPCDRLTDKARNCVTAALFRVQQRGPILNPGGFAAYVDYQGSRYVAGPPVRRPDDEGSDRTATVLTLLSQLFALNFSPGAQAPPPSRINTN